mmetsp:Transcript_15207/g.31079  ORF Transcript_15207/g.31079 Transcript_15207/m.31079 type:complete len:80 (-) Transcript_15207:226-465(-)
MGRTEEAMFPLLGLLDAYLVGSGPGYLGSRLFQYHESPLKGIDSTPSDSTENLGLLRTSWLSLSLVRPYPFSAFWVAHI